MNFYHCLTLTLLSWLENVRQMVINSVECLTISAGIRAGITNYFSEHIKFLIKNMVVLWELNEKIM